MNYNFEWDNNKAKLNIKNHKVSFEQGASVFKDPKALTIFDEEHSKNEERWITLGISSNGTIFLVCHTFRQIDNNNVIIRIISSRKATKHEQQQYLDTK